MRTRRRDSPLDVIRRAPAVRALAEAMAAGKRCAASGSSGSSTALVCAAVGDIASRPVLLVVAHLDDADEAVDELTGLGVDARRLCALEMLPGESAVSLELFAERLGLVRSIVEHGPAPGSVLVCPIQALMQTIPAVGRLESLVLALAPGDARGPQRIVRWLDGAGYSRVDAIEEPGDFALRGGIVDIFPPGSARADAAGSAAVPVRLDFFGDELESISEIDLETMGSDRRIDRIELVGASLEAMRQEDESACFLDILPREMLPVVHETMETTEQGRGYYERVTDASSIIGPPAIFKRLQERFTGFAEINQFSAAAARADTRIDLPVRALPHFSTDVSEAVAELGKLTAERAVLVLCQNEGERSRLGELLAEFASGKPVDSLTTYLHRGFIWDAPDAGGAEGAALVPYHELLNRTQTRRRIRRLKAGRAMDAFLELQEGDYVVHVDHGVAKFLGLRTMKRKAPPGASVERKRDVESQSEEYLTLEFAQSARLHVPAAQIDKVQKYVGGFRGHPPLSALGGKRWQKQKDQVSEAVRDLAAEMLRVQAAREHMPGVRYPADTTWQREFEAEFPYEETEDQLAALAEIKRDMQSARPMDRLVCGDVGYGKTELAIRAAFKCAEYGKQVAVLVPTTVLAEQHERTFRSRFADYPFRVESLSRFKTKQEQNAVIKAVGKGQVDLVIGTHRLLSQDVRFADLGLVIVDEEQRFGVEHKQRLLSLRMTVDVLTLSATPIPRTLHMSLLGIRDISSLATPPMDRRAIVTEVIPYNERRLSQVIARELNREGQIFFVHNRVHNIRTVADEVQKLAPGAKILIGHGQMPTGELEDVMLRFVRREADIFVCTTIIESGIDIPTANTMIINDADRFGLADLHQLRGRVGRYKHRAYCYLLLPDDRTVTPNAKRRLKAIEEFSMLGAGFKIAMRDLEIRGAGNLLGAEQSGHIAAVGYEMYCQLLERAVKELKSEPVTTPTETTIDIGVAGSLPKPYIPSDGRRMEAYRRLTLATTPAELEAVERDLKQAYGEPPKAAQRLLGLSALRIGAMALGVRAVVVQERDVIIRCEAPGPVVAALEGVQGTVRALAPRMPGALHEVYFRPPDSFMEPDSLLLILRRRFCAESTPEAVAG
ncbi:MAG: transcription-repair coupling factor [Phycisphaeraceae bacterium]|nr:MAG: transcription-repair coupling factor [Phycisphaeraceae bacterium]